MEHELVVEGVPPAVKENDVRCFYGRFGAITKVRVEEESHRAFVAFCTAEAVRKAVAAPLPRFRSANLRVFLSDKRECVFVFFWFLRFFLT